MDYLKRIRLYHFLLENEFSFLLSTLFLLIIVPSFFWDETVQHLVIHILLSIVLLAGVNSVIDDVKLRRVGGVLAFISFGLHWLDFFIPPSTFLSVLRIVFFLIFLTVILYHQVRLIYTREVVTIDTIYGAFNGFLLMGLIGGFHAMLIETILPSSYDISLQTSTYLDFDLIYFSFVTQTTLGYGDVVPLSTPAKTLSIILSISGQIYMTFLVAMLVGKYIRSNSKSD